MGFADYSIAEIAQDYNLKVETVLELCQQLGINYQDEQTKVGTGRR
jgi:DNA-binding MurR/RpiR family transcriptional regulator